MYLPSASGFSYARSSASATTRTSTNIQSLFSIASFPPAHYNLVMASWIQHLSKIRSHRWYLAGKTLEWNSIGLFLPFFGWFISKVVDIFMECLYNQNEKIVIPYAGYPFYFILFCFVHLYFYFYFIFILFYVFYGLSTFLSNFFSLSTIFAIFLFHFFIFFNVLYLFSVSCFRFQKIKTLKLQLLLKIYKFVPTTYFRNQLRNYKF